MLYTFLSNILEPFSYLIFSLAFFLECRRDRTIKVRVLLVHYLIATILMTYAAWKAFNQEDNRWIYTLLCLQSAVFICYYFHELFIDKKKKLIIKGLIGINVFYFILNALVFKQFFYFDSFGYALLSVSVSILAFMYFLNVLRNNSEKQLWYDFNFWLVSGYLVYFLVSFGIFLTYHNLTNKILDTFTDEERELLTVLWGLHNVLLFLSAMTTLFGNLWITYRKK